MCVQVIFDAWALDKCLVTKASLNRRYSNVITTDVVSRVISQMDVFQRFHSAGTWKTFGKTERHDKFIDIIVEIDYEQQARRLAARAAHAARFCYHETFNLPS